MAIYESSKVRENLTGSMSSTTYDTLIGNKGTEADSWLARVLREIYEKSGVVKELPVFSISAGTVNGSTAPQDLKDLSTNRATYLCCLTLGRFDAAKEYKEHVKEQLQGIQDGLQVTEKTNVPCAII